MSLRSLALVLWLLTAGTTAWPQLGGAAQIKVRISTTDDRPAPRHLRVELVTAGELYIASAFTDDEGHVEFTAPPGNYRIRVSGLEIIDAVSPVFTIYRGDQASFQNVRVALRNADTTETKPNLATISRASLSVPDEAQKEYKKAVKAMKNGDWAGARSRLERAIALYPMFAAAHNDLGVVFMTTGEKQKGRAAFEKAVEIDPNYGRPYRNLAIMKLSEGSLVEAASLAEKALAAEPLDPQTLLIMAQVCLQTGKAEQAALHARHVHDGPHEGFAVAHLLAAQALERQNLTDQAAVEYRLFLKEAPNSRTAPQIREAIEKLTAKSH